MILCIILQNETNNSHKFKTRRIGCKACSTTCIKEFISGNGDDDNPPKFQYVAEREESSMKSAAAKLSKRAGVSGTPKDRSSSKKLSAIRPTVRRPKTKVSQARKSIEYVGVVGETSHELRAQSVR